MLKRDYLSEEIGEFIKVVRSILGSGSDDDLPRQTEALEEAVADLFDLDAPMLLNLAPASLVTMVELSGDSDVRAAHAAEGLLLAASCHERCGEDAVAALRREQARAVAEAYGLDPLNPMGDTDEGE